MTDSQNRGENGHRKEARAEKKGDLFSWSIIDILNKKSFQRQANLLFEVDHLISHYYAALLVPPSPPTHLRLFLVSDSPHACTIVFIIHQQPQE